MFIELIQEYFYIALIIACFGAFLLQNHLHNQSKNRNHRKSESKNDITTGEEDFSEVDASISNDLSPSLPEDLQHVPYKLNRLPDDVMLKRSVDYYEAMKQRRSVRFFSTDPVPEEVVRNIIKTAGTAPSGAHTEPWTFVLIKDQSIKEQVREIIEEEEYFNYKQRMSKQWTADLRPLKTNWHKQYLTDAPYIILVYKQLYSLNPDGTKRNHYYNELSVAIAVGIMLSAIQNAGLVTLTSTPLQCGPKLRSLLGRPPQEKLVLLFPVGFPSDDCTVPDLERKSYDEICVEL